VINISSEQWYAWIEAFFWPFLRVLGLIVAEPVLGNRAVPVTVKVGFAVFVTLVIAPLLPPMPPVAPDSAAGLLVAIQQLLIGLAMGFTIRIALTAAEMAGQLSGLQMGLGFAVFFDPQSSAQTAAVGQFVGLFAILIFLSANGHALVFSTLAESFTALPVAAVPLAPSGLRVLIGWAAVIFYAGLLIALPVIAALLIANIAVGIMTRAAPQLNLFAVGFPITLMTGFVALYLAVPYMGPALGRLFEHAVLNMGRIVEAFGSH
jgi:flagellar biosynthetic protein FliR